MCLAAAHVAQQNVHPRAERRAVARPGGAALHHADQAVGLLLRTGFVGFVGRNIRGVWWVAGVS